MVETHVKQMNPKTNTLVSTMHGKKQVKKRCERRKVTFWETRVIFFLARKDFTLFMEGIILRHEFINVKCMVVRC